MLSIEVLITFKIVGFWSSLLATSEKMGRQYRKARHVRWPFSTDVDDAQLTKVLLFSCEPARRSGMEYPVDSCYLFSSVVARHMPICRSDFQMGALRVHEGKCWHKSVGKASIGPLRT